MHPDAHQLQHLARLFTHPLACQILLDPLCEIGDAAQRRAEVVRRSMRSIDAAATAMRTVERLLALWEELREVEEIFTSEADLVALLVELAEARQRRRHNRHSIG